jgi:hypothetical protein
MSGSPYPAVSLVRTLRRPSPPSARGPALYVLGWESATGAAPLGSPAGSPVAFRLPCPPTLDQPLGVAAGERRVRKAYFATLDALRTGHVDPDAEGKLARLTREVRSLGARRELQRLQRVQRFVREQAAGWPVIAAPRAPLARVVATVPAGRAAPRADEPLIDQPLVDERFAHRYAWALDWLRMHRWVAGRGLTLEWRRADEAPAALAPRAGLAA